MKVDDIKNREDAIAFVREIGRGDRQVNYGSPEDNFERISKLQQVYRELKINKDKHDASDVAIEMILMKVARLMNNPKHMDSVVDIIGYALCLVDIITSGAKTFSFPVCSSKSLGEKRLGKKEREEVPHESIL